jgi:hypothetical protein
MKAFLGYILQRLQESSTWQGLVLVWTAIGITLHHEATQEILGAGLALVGAIKILTEEKPQL